MVPTGAIVVDVVELGTDVDVVVTTALLIGLTIVVVVVWATVVVEAAGLTVILTGADDADV